MAQIKTVTTTSGTNSIKFDAHYPYIWFKNIGSGDVYVSDNSQAQAGADDTALLKAGEIIRITAQTDTVYVVGATTVEVHAQGFADCPFKKRGKGGEIELTGISITENGTYTPPSGKAYGRVDVSVITPAVVSPLTVTENGTYNAPTGVDGYSPVTVNVPVGAEIITRSAWDALTTAEKQSKGLVAIQDSASGYNRGVLVNGADYRDTLLQYSNYADILVEAKSDTHESGTAVWDTLTLSGEMDNASDGAVVTGGKTVSYSLSAANTDVTIYALMRRSSLTETGNRTMIGIPYSSSGDNLPNIFTNGAGVYTSVYGSDIMHPSLNSTEYTLYSMAVDATNKTVDFFADGTLIRSGVSFSNSGGYVVFGAADVELLNVLSCDIKFIGIVGAYEQATNIIANHNHIMDVYGM